MHLLEHRDADVAQPLQRRRQVLHADGDMVHGLSTRACERASPRSNRETDIIITSGANYGWPIASYSRQYSGQPATETPWLEGLVGPEIVWWPSVAPSGMTFYTGEHFPAWRGDLFVGSMRVGRMQSTGHLERIVFNRRGQEIRREALLTELKQRIRDVRQGPDGYLYVLTEEDNAVLLRIEPARAVTEVPGSIIPARRLTAPRIPPLPEAEWTEEHRALVAKYAPDGEPGNALRTLMRAPALADRVFPLLMYVANDSTLTPRHRTMLILRTAWLTQNANLWATYASRADAAGLTAEEVLRVAAGPVARVAEGDSEGWSEFEGFLIGMADQLFRNSSVNDLTWEVLSERYDLHNMMDAVVTVNEITAQSILFNSLGIQPDDDATARIPTNDVGYSVVVPEREPLLTVPRIDPVDGDALRVRRTLSRHSEIAAQWNANPRYVLDPEKARLTPHDRELLILRMGWNTQAVYEWAKHVGSVGRARPRSRAPLDRAGWGCRWLECQRAGAHRRGERDVSRLDHLRQDVERPVSALRHAPDDQHCRDRIAVSEGVDDAQCVWCSAAPGRRAVPGARGVLTYLEAASSSARLPRSMFAM